MTICILQEFVCCPLKRRKNEPDILTMTPDIDWGFTDEEREYIIDAKMNNKLDDLFRMLFIKQCNLLHDVLPGLFEKQMIIQKCC